MFYMNGLVPNASPSPKKLNLLTQGVTIQLQKIK